MPLGRNCLHLGMGQTKPLEELVCCCCWLLVVVVEVVVVCSSSIYIYVFIYITLYLGAFLFSCFYIVIVVPICVVFIVIVIAIGECCYNYCYCCFHACFYYIVRRLVTSLLVCMYVPHWKVARLAMYSFPLATQSPILDATSFHNRRTCEDSLEEETARLLTLCLKTILKFWMFLLVQFTGHVTAMWWKEITSYLAMSWFVRNVTFDSGWIPTAAYSEVSGSG